MIHKALISLRGILCVAIPVSALAQGGNPFDADQTAILAGGALYAGRCAECHGADAKGISGPNMTLLWEAGTNDSNVFDSIRDGVPGSIMPPSTATDNEIWAIVAYLKSVSTVPRFESPSGDTEHGRTLFVEHCVQCHRVGGEGGMLGPDLTRIAQVRSRDVLARSIRDPSASVAAGYRSVTLVTRDGQRIEAATKSEDAFSIQVVDTTERLQGYRKADLVELTREERSLMPVFGPDRLSEAQLDDLLAYLGTLRAAD